MGAVLDTHPPLSTLHLVLLYHKLIFQQEILIPLPALKKVISGALIAHMGVYPGLGTLTHMNRVSNTVTSGSLPNTANA